MDEGKNYGSDEYVKKYREMYYEKNKEKIKERVRLWYTNNKEHALEYSKKYRKQYMEKNKGRMKEHSKIYRSNPEVKARLIAYQKKYRVINKERLFIRDKLYRQRPDVQVRLKKISQLYREKLGYVESKQMWHKQYNARPEIRENHRIYATRQYRTDVLHRFKSMLRHRLYLALKGHTKYSSVLKLLDCDFDYFKKYIESQFDDEMAWYNYGKWHIDHKIPCKAFDLTKEEEQKNCFHYTNLQPLWAEQNHRKGGRYESGHYEKIEEAKG